MLLNSDNLPGVTLLYAHNPDEGVLSRTHVHSGTVGVNHSVQNHKLYSDQLTMHTCGENYKAIYDCIIRNKAKGITSENRNQERQSRSINMYNSNSRLILRKKVNKLTPKR